MSEEHLIGAKQASQQLGVSTQTLSRWAREGKELPFTRVGDKLMYKEEDIRAYIKQKTTEPTREVVIMNRYNRLMKDIQNNSVSREGIRKDYIKENLSFAASRVPFLPGCHESLSLVRNAALFFTEGNYGITEISDFQDDMQVFVVGTREKSREEKEHLGIFTRPAEKHPRRVQAVEQLWEHRLQPDRIPHEQRKNYYHFISHTEGDFSNSIYSINMPLAFRGAGKIVVSLELSTSQAIPPLIAADAEQTRIDNEFEKLSVIEAVLEDIAKGNRLTPHALSLTPEEPVCQAFTLLFGKIPTMAAQILHAVPHGADTISELAFEIHDISNMECLDNLIEAIHQIDITLANVNNASNDTDVDLSDPERKKFFDDLADRFVGKLLLAPDDGISKVLPVIADFVLRFNDTKTEELRRNVQMITSLYLQR